MVLFVIDLVIHIILLEFVIQFEINLCNKVYIL